jgi:hypothetical protein
MPKGTKSLKSFLCRGPEQANIQSPETGLPQANDEGARYDGLSFGRVFVWKTLYQHWNPDIPRLPILPRVTGMSLMSLPHGVQARRISKLPRQGHSTTLGGGQIGQTMMYIQYYNSMSMEL